MVKPITSELMSVWITGDGKFFTYEEDAIKHQNTLVIKEKSDIKNKIAAMEKELMELSNA